MHLNGAQQDAGGTVRTALYTSEGTDFAVHRVMPVSGFEHMDPLILIDELGPDVPPGDKTGFEIHPHAGLEVFSYVLEGTVEGQVHWPVERPMVRVRAGGTMWINFGAGGAHYERPLREVIELGGRCHVVQLWFALPSQQKALERVSEAQFAADENPVWTAPSGDVRVRVLLGEAFGCKAPAQIATEATYMHATLDCGAGLQLPVPDGHASLAYIIGGSVQANGQQLVARQSLALAAGAVALNVRADETGASILFVTGRPHGEPIIQVATFVMNSMDEIGECFVKYGRFLNIEFG